MRTHPLRFRPPGMGETSPLDMIVHFRLFCILVLDLVIGRPLWDSGGTWSPVRGADSVCCLEVYITMESGHASADRSPDGDDSPETIRGYDAP